MYQIHKQHNIIELTFDGVINAEEISHWVEHSKFALESQAGSYGLIVNMQTMKEVSDEVAGVLSAGLKLYKSKGLERSVVIVDSLAKKTQMTTQAQETGTYQWERCVNVDGGEDWREVALAWIKDGVDPDRQAVKMTA